MCVPPAANRTRCCDTYGTRPQSAPPPSSELATANTSDLPSPVRSTMHGGAAVNWWWWRQVKRRSLQERVCSNISKPYLHPSIPLWHAWRWNDWGGSARVPWEGVWCRPAAQSAWRQPALLCGFIGGSVCSLTPRHWLVQRVLNVYLSDVSEVTLLRSESHTNAHTSAKEWGHDKHCMERHATCSYRISEGGSAVDSYTIVLKSLNLMVIISGNNLR